MSLKNSNPPPTPVPPAPAPPAPPHAVIDVAQMELRARAVAAILALPNWTAANVALYLDRSEQYCKILMRRGMIRKDRQNRTRRCWVDAYLLKPRAGRYRSDIR